MFDRRIIETEGVTSAEQTSDRVELRLWMSDEFQLKPAPRAGSKNEDLGDGSKTFWEERLQPVSLKFNPVVFRLQR